MKRFISIVLFLACLVLQTAALCSCRAAATANSGLAATACAGAETFCDVVHAYCGQVHQPGTALPANSIVSPSAGHFGPPYATTCTDGCPQR